MHKTAMINTRIDPTLKVQAENVLNNIGLSPADAIRLFYKQVCLNHGLPFEVKIPNATTQKAMNAAELRKTTKAKNVDSLFEELL